MMDLTITFPGGARVDAAFDGYVVRTDRSLSHGGEGSAPEPFDVFLASLGTCAGAYVLAFCDARRIPIAGIRLLQHCSFNEAHRLERVEIAISLPPSFPEKYRAGVRAAADACKVKKTLASPPELEVTTVLQERGASEGVSVAD